MDPRLNWIGKSVHEMTCEIRQTAEIERKAIELYEADGFMLAMYKTGAESWPHDREGVREQYRAKARAALSSR